MIDRLARLETTRTAARLASLAGVVLVVAAFGLLVGRAVTLDFFNRQPVWVADAIPAALSELYYGHDKRYTALESVRRRFFARVDREVATARTVNAALRRLEETAEDSRGQPYVLLGPDDKGIVDLIEGGFLLFGLRAESIAAFYFTLLLLSSLLYVMAFWRSPAALLVMAAFLGMFYLVEPMIMHNGQLRSILALRVLPILSMVACLHCLLFMATSLHARVRAWQIVLVALQVVLIAFTIHLRSTTLWQVATILGFGVAVAMVPGVWEMISSRLGKKTPTQPSPSQGEGSGGGLRASQRSALLAAGATIGLMVGGYLGLQAYQAIALPEEYRRGDEIATRVFWHNIFTGLAYHPELHERFKIWLDDVSIMAATGRYLQESGQQDRWLAMGGKLPILDPGSGSASEFEGVKFAPYDPAVKEMLIARCSTLVRECLETLVWYKPASLLGNLAWLYGFRALPPDLEVTVSPYFGDILEQQIIGMTSGMDGSGRRAFLWTPLVLTIVAPFVVLLLAETRERILAACWACVGLTLGSTIPTVVGYAAPHTIVESGIAVGMLVYLGICVALAAVLRRAVNRLPAAKLPIAASGWSTYLLLAPLFAPAASMTRATPANATTTGPTWGRIWAPGLLAISAAIAIASLAFVYGGQVVAFDAAGYFDYGRIIATEGPAAFASDLRTYGYPAFIAAIILVVGEDVDDVQRAAFIVQLLLSIGVAWIGARRIEGALGRPGIGQAIFAVTVLNPFLLVHSVQVLTDLPAAMLIYLAVVLGLPQHRSESAGRVTILASASLCCAGLAVMMRPSSMAVAPVVGLIWLGRAALYRDVPWSALPAALIAFVVPFVPQVWSNQRAFGVPSPLIVSSLYADQLVLGLHHLKYATLVVPGVPNSMFYNNPFRLPTEDTVGQMLAERPWAYLATLAVHAFGLVDQDFPFTYIRDVNPWYRWPLSLLNYVFLLGSLVGLAIRLRTVKRESAAGPGRQRFTMLALGTAVAALVAIYLPTAVESRYSLPLYFLLAAPFVLTVQQVSARLPTTGPVALSLGTLGVAAWVGLCSASSVWVQAQAPLLVEVREGRPVARATAPREASPPRPQAPTAGPPTLPAREIPVTKYEASLPTELVVRRMVEFDVTVTNVGKEPWNRTGEYPVNVATRFIARSTDLYERVKGLMRDSQPATLPHDVEPGASATVHVRVTAPPEAGRYTLLVHVTRFGVPDADTKLERAVRVTEGK